MRRLLPLRREYFFDLTENTIRSNIHIKINTESDFTQKYTTLLTRTNWKAGLNVICEDLIGWWNMTGSKKKRWETDILFSLNHLQIRSGTKVYMMRVVFMCYFCLKMWSCFRRLEGKCLTCSGWAHSLSSNRKTASGNRMQNILEPHLCPVEPWPSQASEETPDSSPLQVLLTTHNTNT